MCTASWSAGQGRLSLCFNRDERKSRAEAMLPAILELPGPKRVAAIDPDGGGSWLAVNEYGLCVYLLNNYAATARLSQGAKGRVSRGELPINLSGFSRRADAVQQLIEKTELADYSPFLLVFADQGGSQAFAWNGEDLDALDVSEGMLTTSSFKTAEVQGYREDLFVASVLESGKEPELARSQFHTGISHEDPAFNPLMLREDSRTHSVSTVTVAGERVVFEYQAVIGETRTLGDRHCVEMTNIASGT